MKNTTNSKLRLISVLLTAVAVTSLLVWQSSQSKRVVKPVHMPAITLKSTSLPALKLLTIEAQKVLANKESQEIVQARSLQGTQPDGAVNLDELGNVKADKDLHRLFDYYLSSLGELEMVEIKKHLMMSASDYLSLNQLEQLRDFFDQYVQYLEQAENFAVSFNEDEPLDQRLVHIKNLRESLLGTEMSEGFFAQEHAYAEWVLRGEHIPTDQLTKQQMHWLELEDKATGYQDVLLENHFFEVNQVSTSDIHSFRIENYGEEAAIRLAELDAQSLNWHAQVENYISQRVLVSSADELEQLNQQYDSKELKRLNVYWNQYLNEG